MAAKKKAVKKSTAKKTNNKKKGTPERITYVYLVVDRSGSMSGLEKATVDGFNEQINSFKILAKKKENGKFIVSAIKFDTEIEPMFTRVEAKNLQPITLNDFQPRGSTALRDSQYTAIQAMQKETDTGDTAFLLVTISDGGENASKDITQSALADMIKNLTATGKWTFTYMLANQDVDQFSKAFNIPTANVAAYTSTAAGTKGAYNRMSSSLGNYGNARGRGLTSTATFYDNTTQPIANTTITNANVNGATPTIDPQLLNINNTGKNIKSRSISH